MRSSASKWLYFCRVKEVKIAELASDLSLFDNNDDEEEENDGFSHILMYYHLPSTMLSIHLIFLIIIVGNKCHVLNFTKEKTEAQRGKITLFFD